MEKILLDTDIGSDIDDSFALAYLLAQKQCEIVGITTVSGGALKRAEMASAVCLHAGRGDIPIYSGLDDPLLHKIKQAEVHQYDKMCFEHRTDFEPNAAVGFMQKTIRKNPHQITLLAIGPLTNVAALFVIDPEIPSLLKRLVIMNGCFEQKGSQKTIKEWNVLCDIHASAIVYKCAPKDFLAVGVDVTSKVFIPAQQHEKYRKIKLLEPVFAFAQKWFESCDRVTYHDPLAAVAIFNPEIITCRRGQVEVVTEGDEAGLTAFTPNPNGNAVIACDVDAPAFFEKYYSIFEQ